MFSQTRVLLILGAGASAEFGLPVGAELKDRIAKDVAFYFGQGGLLQDGDEALYGAFKRQCSNPARAVTIGRELASVLSIQYTVDEALHYLSSDADAIMLGKFAIVRRILQGEHDSVLAHTEETGLPKVERATATWINHFLSMVLAGLRKEEAANCLASVSVVNFNYDRSLEHYLYWALQEHGHIDAETAKTALARMNVIRPYGSIGKLDWEEPVSGIQYGDTKRANHDPTRYAANIRTFTEQCDSETPERIHQAIKTAGLILILGFGFHQQNVELLSPAADQRSSSKATICSAFGINEVNYNMIKRTLHRSLGGSGSIARVILRPSKAGPLFEELRPTIINLAR